MANEVMESSSFKVHFQPAELTIANYEDMKEMVKNYADLYSQLVFEEDDKAGLQDARSELLALHKALETERKNVKRIYNEPLEEFEGRVKYLVELIDEPLTIVRDGIKAIEDAELELRQELLTDLLERSVAEEPISLDVLDISDQWTNKGSWTSTMLPTAKLAEEVKREITRAVQAYETEQTNIQLLSAFCEARGLDPSGWLGQLEFKSAPQVINEIEAEAKQQREAKLAQQVEIERQQKEAEQAQPAHAADAPSSHAPVEHSADERTYTNTIQVTGTREQLMALNTYLMASGIHVIQVA